MAEFAGFAVAFGVAKVLEHGKKLLGHGWYGSRVHTVQNTGE
jgi:hypothetical protein